MPVHIARMHEACHFDIPSLLVSHLPPLLQHARARACPCAYVCPWDVPAQKHRENTVSPAPSPFELWVRLMSRALLVEGLPGSMVPFLGKLGQMTGLPLALQS